jgi:methylmalonyl-CoA/ethylmalonyl-CoA epimerase
MLSQLGQIALNVEDLERAVEFYRDTLQVPFLFEFPGLAFFDRAGIRLMLSKPEASEAHGGSSVLYFKVADIEAEARLLTSRNVKFEQAPHLVARMPDHELWMAFFRDPDGNLLALMSEVR